MIKTPTHIYTHANARTHTYIHRISYIFYNFFHLQVIFTHSRRLFLHGYKRTYWPTVIGHKVCELATQLHASLGKADGIVYYCTCAHAVSNTIKMFRFDGCCVFVLLLLPTAVALNFIAKCLSLFSHEYFAIQLVSRSPRSYIVECIRCTDGHECKKRPEIQQSKKIAHKNDFAWNVF